LPHLEFSVPYNSDEKTLEELFKLKSLGGNSIREVYLSGPQKFSGSGREPPEISPDEFFKIVDRIHQEGLRVNLVMNSTCEGSNWYTPEVVREKMGFIKTAHHDHGVEAVTLANPIYVKETRRCFPDIEISASVLADIDCLQRAMVFAEAGANVITPDVSINRDLKLLQDIRDYTGAELKLMVNEGCLYRCPYRKFHFNFTSHKSKELTQSGIGGGIFVDNCNKVIEKEPSQVLKSCWIRPEDLGKYGDVTRYFKIVGRAMPRSKVLRCVKAYMQESWDGGVLDLLCASMNTYNLTHYDYLDNKSLDGFGFFEKTTSCRHDCTDCNYCKELAARLIKFGGSGEGQDIASGKETCAP
jgi:collagenase-like PrtC family protease